MHRRGLIAMAGSLAALHGATAAVEPRPLRAAWDDYPPYQMPGASGEPEGLDLVLSRAVLRQAGLQARWQRMPWARQLLSLQDGSLDLVLSASKVPDRESYALWTQPYRPENGAPLARRRGDRPPPKHLRELADGGARIGMIRGTGYPGELHEAKQDPRFLRRLLPLRHVEQGLRMLQDGRLDYLIDDPVATNHLAAQLGLPAPVVLRWVYRGESRLMLSRRSEQDFPGLLARLNAAIQILREQGELRRLSAGTPGLEE